jgi:putative ABC transport system permease protein
VLATLNERRREMAILRSVGARPRTVLGLLVAEAGLLGLLGTVFGVVLLYLALLIVRPLVDAAYGLYLDIGWLTVRELSSLLAVISVGLLAGLLPALYAYRLSLADGMMVRT